MKPISQIYINKDMNRGIRVEAHIADIHFGALDPKLQFNILREQFILKLQSLRILHAVYINGDIFDHKNLASSDIVMYANMFIDLLAELCRSKDATLIILHGTSSHDANQLKLFYRYLNNPDYDVRIIEQMQFEFIKGKRVLCIPEEYSKGKEYYEYFLDRCGIYDMAVMHGTIKGSIHGAIKEDLEAPHAVFSLNSFKNCRGPVIAGHVHTPGCFERYMYYSGTPIRHCFGEEEEKGFIILLHDLDTGYHKMEFEPIKSFRYDTVNLDYMLKVDPKEAIAYITQLKESGIDNIRVEFTINEQDRINIIKNYFRNNSNVKIFENFEKGIKTTVDVETTERFQEYDFILDDTYSDYEKFVMYVNKNEGFEFITCDELLKLLEED